MSFLKELFSNEAKPLLSTNELQAEIDRLNAKILKVRQTQEAANQRLNAIQMERHLSQMQTLENDGEPVMAQLAHLDKASEEALREVKTTEDLLALAEQRMVDLQAHLDVAEKRVALERSRILIRQRPSLGEPIQRAMIALITATKHAEAHDAEIQELFVKL